MRRLTVTSLLVLATLVLTVTGCSGSDGDQDAAQPSTTTTTAVPADPTTGADEALAALMLSADDLPAGFAASADVDDTITSFCANEDAAAGLQAAAREIRGFTRTAGGASVIQLAFRFHDDGAARFVAQAGEVLGRCSGVPDAKGLAFDYDDLAPELDTVIDDASEAHVGRHGVNVGSATLAIDLVVLQHGDVGQLVAVLGLDLPRDELDALAATAFGAVATKIVP